MKLLPLLAFNYAMTFTYLKVKEVFLGLKKDAEDGNFEKLNMMHHLTSGFKSLYT